MKKSPLFLLIAMVGFFGLPMMVYAVPWPNTIQHAGDIKITNPGRYEPSGLVWNPVTNRLFAVSDDGQVTRMNLDGSRQETVSLTYVAPDGGRYRDFEAITIADPNSNRLYIGLEHKDSILEVAWPEGGGISITRAWNLTDVLIGPDNSGLEGLTFVPDGYHPFGDENGQTTSGGLFYAGIQRTANPGGATTDDYSIYAFDLDLNPGGARGAWVGIPVAPGIPTSDVSDLSFNQDTGRLYVLYDGANRLIEMNTGGEVLRDYSGVPYIDQEGIAVVTHYPSFAADLYMGSDFFNESNYNDPNNKLIGRFSGYSVTYYDADHDEIDAIADCNDDDPTVSADQSYYPDADGDGVGTGMAQNFCLALTPAGYTTNAQTDCNDNDAAVSAYHDYYRDLDGDGAGSGAAESFCANLPPPGYSDNNQDLFEGVEPIIKDGGFEIYGEGGNSADWLPYGNSIIQLTNEDPFQGGYSVKINTTGFSGGIQQLGLRVEAGKSYRLAVNQKMLSGRMMVFLAVGTSNAVFESSQVYTYPKRMWQPAISEITIPLIVERNGQSYVNPDGTIRDFRLVIILQNGEGYIDTISLEEIDAADQSLVYPFGTANWGPYNELPALEEMIMDEQNPENSVLHMVAGNGTTGLEQTIEVQGGSTYELSYDLLIQAGKVNPYLIIRIISRHGDFENFVNNLYAYSHQDWTTVSRIFTVPQEYNLMNVRFGVAPASDVFFKNLVLRKIPDDPFENNVVRDGDMEWLNPGLWTNIYTPEVKTKRDGALQVRSRPGFYYGIYQNSLKNLEPDTIYTLSFDAKVVAGSVRPFIGHNTANSDFEKLRAAIFRNENEDWIHFTDTFTTLADPTKPYSLLIMTYRDWGTNYAEVYIDHVVITEVGPAGE